MSPRFVLDPGRELRRALPPDTGLVLEVLNAAAAWLQGRGVRQWPARFTEASVAPSVVAGHTWLAIRDKEPVGTLTLDWSDPLWDDRAAAYIHRLAVVPSALGLGLQLLQWATGHAREHGATALRGDCVAGNTVLRSYYERLGCVHRGDATVGGSPGERLATGPQTTVSRYELDLRDRS
ncbi:MAG TPA: GNAT family N-acetyltransferase [Dermatophilaceae bacterium]|nr:GNAT family N-acetyltransferase [Dermatophilaceae bacterium]